MKKYNHLVRSLFCIILIIILQIPTSAKLTYSKIATFSEAYIPSEDTVNNAHDLAEATRALGYDENHPIIEFAKKEYKTANEYLKIYTERLNEINN